MSAPLRIPYQPGPYAPRTADLLAKVTRDRHMVLELPASTSKAQLDEVITLLIQKIPEHYHVFDSGSSRVTIKEVVCRAAVLDMEAYLVDVAQHFRRTATGLMDDLAAHHGIPVEALWDHFHSLQSHSAEWLLYPHGEHCCFRHQLTHQTLQISVWFGKEFGVLDPQFFHDYMRTSPDLLVPLELRDAFHDTARAMAILEERGSLVRVAAAFGGEFGHTGLAAPAERY